MTDTIRDNIRAALAHHVGRENRISRWALVAEVFGTDIPEWERNDQHPLDRQMREAIREMRRAGIPICSDSSGGYWRAGNINEVLTAAEKLRRRAKDLLATASDMEQAGRVEFGGQMELIP
jgi:hypothetical protein